MGQNARCKLCVEKTFALSFFTGSKIPREICTALPSAFHSQQSDAHFSTLKIIVGLACALASNLSKTGNCEPGQKMLQSLRSMKLILRPDLLPKPFGGLRGQGNKFLGEK